MKIEELAKKMNKSRVTIYRYIKLGMPYESYRGKNLYTLADCLEWLKNRHRPKMCSCGRKVKAKGLCRKCYDLRRRSR